MATKKIVSTDDGKIGTSEFRAQATTEAGKVFGVQSDGTVGLIDKQDIIQYSTMPTASAENVGKIVQYVGETTTDYTNGCFYKSTLESGSYVWKSTAGNYLPLSGGTMEGDINTGEYGINIGGNGYIGSGTNRVYITASDGSGGGKVLIAVGDNGGELTWDSKKVLTEGDVIDNLTSTSTTDALSANQGKVLKDTKQDIIQYSTMPTASETYNDKIIQYIGETTFIEPIYTNGYYYKCILDFTTSDYKWSAIHVQDITGEYLPLTGGDMQGDIGIGNVLKIRDSNSDNYLMFNIDGFVLHAGQLTYGSELVGKVDSSASTLTWNNNTVLDSSYIVNNVTSSSSINVLSAKQGKVLNDKFADYLPLAGGTMTGAIAMGSNKVTGLDTPTADTDACTKAYADKMLPLAGGTMTGTISFKNTVGVYWNETGYGDQFQISPSFSGSGDENYLAIKSAVGGAGELPSLTDKVKILGSSGDVILMSSLGFNGTTNRLANSSGTLTWGGKNVITKSYNDVTITGIDVTIGVMDHYDCFEIGGVVNINACMKIDTAVSATTHFLKFSKTPIRSMSITLNKLTNTPQANRLVIETSGEGYFYDMNLAAGDWIQITGTYRTND